MLELDTEYRNAGNYGWFAARDAWRRSAENAGRFSDKQKAKAESMKYALELVYSAKEISITFCKKWIRVKVHNPVVRDKKNLALLESDWTKSNVVKVHTQIGRAHV